MSLNKMEFKNLKIRVNFFWPAQNKCCNTYCFFVESATSLAKVMEVLDDRVSGIRIRRVYYKGNFWMIFYFKNLFHLKNVVVQMIGLVFISQIDYLWIYLYKLISFQISRAMLSMSAMKAILRWWNEKCLEKQCTLMLSIISKTGTHFLMKNVLMNVISYD